MALPDQAGVILLTLLVRAASSASRLEICMRHIVCQVPSMIILQVFISLGAAS